MLRTGVNAGTLGTTDQASVPVVVPREKDRASVNHSNARVTRPETVRVWGTNFARIGMEETVNLADSIIQAGHPEFFVTANLNYLMLTEHHPRLVEINSASLAVLADGHPIVLRSKLTKQPLTERVAGSDLIVELAKLSSERGYRIFFLGAAPGVAQQAADNLQQRFPSMQLAGCYAPPYRPMSAAENNDMISQIRNAKPDILLVAFGQPKGEFWIYDNLKDLNVPLSIQLGASFDFLAGTARRAPKFCQNTGSEWLFRALSDPRRLGPRYAANIGFLGRKVIAESLGYKS